MGVWNVECGDVKTFAFFIFLGWWGEGGGGGFG